MRSGARFAAKAMVLSAASDDAAIKIAVRRIGPALVFERLWEETGCRAVIDGAGGQRKHGFALERAVFLTVLHRLFVSGSDRAADRWREDYRDRRRRGARSASSLSGDGVAGRGAAGEGAGRPHAVRTALPEGRGRGAAVRASARSAHAARPGVHGHHQPLLRGRGRPDAGPARLQQGSSAGPAADDPGGADRRRRAAGVLGDVAGQHRRRDDADPGDRPAAPALRHRARVRGRRPRHDQCRDHGRAGGAAAALYPGRARALGQAGARAGARRSGAVRAAGDEASAARRSTTRPRR